MQFTWIIIKENIMDVRFPPRPNLFPWMNFMNSIFPMIMWKDHWKLEEITLFLELENLFMIIKNRKKKTIKNKENKKGAC